MRRTCFALACILLSQLALSEAASERSRISEASLLKFAERRPDPACLIQTPTERSVGVAVADLELAADGRLLSITLLEAPTLEIAQCIRESLRGWRFRAIGGKHSSRYWGKLTFYALLDSRGEVVVRHATNAPSVHL